MTPTPPARTRRRCRPTLPLAALALACFAVLGCGLGASPARAQTCLPGQQPCDSTCCDTAANYTCCPYNGGYCAPPDQFCCESSDSGLCPKGDTCCEGGCATSEQECCDDDICASGLCCSNDDNETGFCRLANQTCCLAGAQGKNLYVYPVVYACPSNSTSCCSILTVRQCNGGNGFPQDALNDCCAPGSVCCPSARPVSEFARQMRLKGMSPAKFAVGMPAYQSDACGRSGGAEPFWKAPVAAGFAGPPGGKGARAETKATACANPETDFCCGGMACPTETLCCAGPNGGGHGDDYADGCCFGLDSKSYSCEDMGNYTCPSSSLRSRP